MSGSPLRYGSEAAITGADGKTIRSLARWDTLRRVGPYLASAGGVVGAAACVSGHRTSVILGVSASVSLVVPAGALKMWLDSREKQRLRTRLGEKEREVAQAREERDRFMRQAAELEGANRELRRGARGGGRRN